MRKIVFSNSKGGVAKTTTTVNVGAALAALGHHVLLIDTDGQGHVAHHLGLQPEQGLPEVILGEADAIDVITTVRDNLDILASNKRIAQATHSIGIKDMRSEYVLRDKLQDIFGYDYVLIDTAPSWSVMSINCLFYADDLAIPVSMEEFSLHGLVEFYNRVQQVSQHHPDLSLRWIIPTMVDARVSQSAALLSQIKEHFGEKVTNPVRVNVRLSESPAHGEHIFEYDRFCRGARDYEALARTISEQSEVLV